MYQVIIVIHILLGLSIVGLILMQQGKGADAGATFGGGASGSVFGAQGAASFLSRTTAILATLFFITSLGLAWINGHKAGESVDFMGTPAVEKEAIDLGLPNVDESAKNKEATPPAAPEKATGASTNTAPVIAHEVKPDTQGAVKEPLPDTAPPAVAEDKTEPKAAEIKAATEAPEKKADKAQKSREKK